jgi:hypothetical protein
MFWVGYLLAFLATTVVGWAVPIVGVALLLPFFQLICILNPWVAMVLMILLVSLLVGHLLYRQAYWQAIFWGALLLMGALTAGMGVFHWYGLFVETVLVILLLAPGIVAPWLVNILRWFAIGELVLTLVFFWGQTQVVPGTTLIIALLLLILSLLVGIGAYRPFEARRIRRRLVGWAVTAAILMLIWQPFLRQVVQWVGDTAQIVTRATLEVISNSPVGRWYHIIDLRVERQELGEASKTEALRQLRPQLDESHRQRWEKDINQIPTVPLVGNEWGNLGVPRDP